MADALADRRDNPALKQAGLLGRHGWEPGDNIYFGSLLLTTMGRDMKTYLDQAHEDASEGIDMMCIMIDRFAKVDDAYLLGLQRGCSNKLARFVVLRHCRGGSWQIKHEACPGSTWGGLRRTHISG